MARTRVGKAQRPDPDDTEATEDTPAEDTTMVVPAGPRRGGGWALAYFTVCCTGGLVALAFADWPGTRAWAAFALYVTLAAALVLLALGVLPRRRRGGAR